LFHIHPFIHTYIHTYTHNGGVNHAREQPAGRKVLGLGDALLRDTSTLS